MTLTPAQKREINKRQLWKILHHGHGVTGHAYNFFSVLLILLSLAILPLEFVPTLRQYHGTLYAIEIITTSIFTIDYALRIYAAPRRARYIFSFVGFVDLLSILPFYIGIFGTQYVRILRIVRLFKLGEIEAAAAEEEQSTMEEGIGLIEGEKVEYVVTRHPLYLFFNSIPPVVATTFGISVVLLFPGNPVTITIAVTLVLFALIFFWKAWLDFSYDVIYVTSQRLIFQNQHLLGRSINQISYPAITNVKPSYPSILSYILRYGSIVIETPAAETGHVELHVVRQHEKAAHIVMQKAAGLKTVDHHPGKAG